MKNFSFLAAIALVISTTPAFAGTFLISGSNTDPSVSADANLEVGETGTFYIWADLDANEQWSAVALDVLSSLDGVIGATDFVTENPTVNLSAFGTQPTRWQGNLGTGSFDTPSKLIDNALSLFVNEGVGLFQAAIAGGVDEGTVVNGDTVLHAAVSYSALAAGTTDLVLGGGSGLSQLVGVGESLPDFGAGASITVGGTVNPNIPEPTTAMLVALGLAGFAARRRV